MVSFTDDLRITLQGDNENPNTWGDVTNIQVIELLCEAIARTATIDVTGSSNIDLSATVVNGGTDDARHAVLELTGTISQDIDLIVPSVQKIYVINALHTGGTVRVIPSGGSTGIDFVTGTRGLLYTNGTNITNLTIGALLASNNLSDILDAATARTNLGLGNTATFDLASQAEAEAGTINDALMSPLRTAQAITALVPAFENAVTTVNGRVGDVVVNQNDVGLSNVQNVDQTDADNITSGTVAPERLGSGTPTANTFLRGDGQWSDGLNLFDSGDVGSIRTLWVVSGGVTDNQVESGTNLRAFALDSPLAGGSVTSVISGSAVTGSWRNISGLSIAGQQAGLFQRVS